MQNEGEHGRGRGCGNGERHGVECPENGTARELFIADDGQNETEQHTEGNHHDRIPEGDQKGTDEIPGSENIDIVLDADEVCDFPERREVMRETVHNRLDERIENEKSEQNQRRYKVEVRFNSGKQRRACFLCFHDIPPSL
jgi:hypothetical protein